MLSSTAYGRNIIPPHICYSIIVQMIDFLVNCISAPYIIKICDFHNVYVLSVWFVTSMFDQDKKPCSGTDGNIAHVTLVSLYFHRNLALLCDQRTCICQFSPRFLCRPTGFCNLYPELSVLTLYPISVNA